MRFLKWVGKWMGFPFLKKEGEKSVIRRKVVFLTVSFVVLSVGSLCIIWTFQRDSSVLAVSTQPIPHSPSQPPLVSDKMNQLFEASKRRWPEVEKKGSHFSRSKVHIKYKAPQVIVRTDSDWGVGLPLGTHIAGRLLTGIDTRESTRLYKVLLPEGGQDKNGGSIPKDTVLFGTIRYPGKGRKVFIHFSKALLPNGKEVTLKAQALSKKDQSPGIRGDFHGATIKRVASTLGLTMLSAATNTLTQKEVSEKGHIPKATVQDAFYQGLSKASEMEAKRQASKLEQAPEYVTVPAGQELIVNLLETYRGEP